MRLRVLSDLHLEHFPNGRVLDEVPADAVILAGDIHQKLDGFAWARARFYGTTLWTDFARYADDPAYDLRATLDKAIAVMPDFQIVTDEHFNVFTPEASQAPSAFVRI